MKDFKYCIWLCPDSNHPWNFFTNKFIPHLSIKTNLDYNASLNLYTKIKKQNIEVELDTPMCAEDQGFHALFYKLKHIDNPPPWWPKNPHISFLYKYNELINTREVNYLYSTLKYKKSFLKNICLVKCSGHFTKWKVLFNK